MPLCQEEDMLTARYNNRLRESAIKSSEGNSGGTNMLGVIRKDDENRMM